MRRKDTLSCLRSTRDGSTALATDMKDRLGLAGAVATFDDPSCSELDLALDDSEGVNASPKGVYPSPVRGELQWLQRAEVEAVVASNSLMIHGDPANKAALERVRSLATDNALRSGVKQASKEVQAGLRERTSQSTGTSAMRWLHAREAELEADSDEEYSLSPETSEIPTTPGTPRASASLRDESEIQQEGQQAFVQKSSGMQQKELPSPPPSPPSSPSSQFHPAPSIAKVRGASITVRVVSAATGALVVLVASCHLAASSARGNGAEFPGNMAVPSRHNEPRASGGSVAAVHDPVWHGRKLQETDHEIVLQYTIASSVAPARVVTDSFTGPVGLHQVQLTGVAPVDKANCVVVSVIGRCLRTQQAFCHPPLSSRVR